jgi:hypothetical protein
MEICGLILKDFALAPFDLGSHLGCVSGRTEGCYFWLTRWLKSTRAIPRITASSLCETKRLSGRDFLARPLAVRPSGVAAWTGVGG